MKAAVVAFRHLPVVSASNVPRSASRSDTPTSRLDFTRAAYDTRHFASRTSRLVASARGVTILGALVLAALAGNAQAQTITPLSPSLTPTQLAQRIVGSGVTVSNVTFQGISSGTNVSAGTFSGGAGILGPTFGDGIVLSSGKVADLTGPNNSGSTSTNFDGSGDPQLNALVAPRTTNDATTLSFNFVPNQQFITFSYVFGSEEYNEFAGSSFNDVFAFFVNGTNVALLPGTSTVVSINNVSNTTNSQFFRNNGRADDPFPTNSPINTELDGLTVVLTVQAQVNVGQTNTIKLAVADVQDGGFDSAVFIQSGTFTAVPAGFSVNDVSVTEGNSGTTNATFTVTLAPATNQTATVAYTTANGTATQPSDYTTTSGTLTFAPGETTKTISVPVKGDTLGEGNETFFVNLSNPTGTGITIGDAQGVGTIENDDAGNQPPSVSNIARSVNEDTTLSFTAAIFDAAFTDPDGNTLQSVRIDTLPANGTLKLGAANVTANQVIPRASLGQLTFTPAANFNGTTSFNYHASDGTSFATVGAQVVITVTPVNDVPTISAIADLSTPKNTPTGAIAFTVGDVETAPGALTLSATSSNLSLVPVANIAFGGSGANRTVTVTPVAGQTGSATINVTVSDGTATASESFVLTVAATNDAPVLNDTSFMVALFGSVSQQLAGSDSNGDALTYSVVSGQLPLGLSLSESGLISGTALQTGTFPVTVQVSDGTATDTGVITLVVTAPAGTRDTLAPTATTDAPLPNASLTYSALVAGGISGQIVDIAPSGATIAGVRRIVARIRRLSDGKVWNGSAFVSVTTFMATATLGAPDATGVREFTFAPGSLLPPASQMPPGNYQLLLTTQDNVGNARPIIVPFSIMSSSSSFSTSSAAFSPSGKSF